MYVNNDYTYKKGRNIYRYGGWKNDLFNVEFQCDRFAVLYYGMFLQYYSKSHDNMMTRTC